MYFIGPVVNTFLIYTIFCKKSITLHGFFSNCLGRTLASHFYLNGIDYYPLRLAVGLVY